MKTYEFINPSDKILFDAPSDEVAALAALFVGQGQCAARDIAAQDRNLMVIGFAFLGGDGGYQEIYGRSIGEGATALAIETSAACKSFRLADGERTSLNDWCKYAHGLQLKGAA